MKRTVTIEAIKKSKSIVSVTFKEGKMVISKFKFFPIRDTYAPDFMNQVCNFVSLGHVPKEKDGFLDVD